MKKILISIFIISVLVRCKSENASPDYYTDLISDNWKIKNVELGQETFFIDDRTCFKADAYVLYLYVDSTFSLITSVNNIYGSFKISTELKELSFHILSGTRVGKNDPDNKIIDDKVLFVFGVIDSFDLSNEKLRVSSKIGTITLYKTSRN